MNDDIFDILKHLYSINSDAHWTFFDQIYILIRYRIEIPEEIERWVKSSGGWG